MNHIHSAAEAGAQAHETLKFSREDGVSNAPGFRSIGLRPGLQLTISRTSTRPPMSFFDIEEAPVQFGFTCSGRHRCTYSGGELRNHVHEMQAGSNGILHLPKSTGTIERPASSAPLVIAVITSPQFLAAYFREDMDMLPPAFQNILDGGTDRSLAWFGPRNPMPGHLLAQILDCPYRGGLRHLFLESRVLELLALELEAYRSSAAPRASETPTLSPTDVERIRHARDILINDMEKPPSLPELAVLVGVNERKLKTGFRRIFGTSVFAYLREYRIQKAYELLRQGDHNVTEAAMTVGYQSLSHFSQAFRERFGILPKAFASQQSRLRTP